MTDLQTFRVHFASGDKVDVQAATSEQARKIAQGKQQGAVTKIKIVRGG